MTNIVCLLYVGWITNYVANRGPKAAESGDAGGGEADRKLEEESKGESLRIMERLDRLESVVNEHIKGQRCACAESFHLLPRVTELPQLNVHCWSVKSTLTYDIKKICLLSVDFLSNSDN